MKKGTWGVLSRSIQILTLGVVLGGAGMIEFLHVPGSASSGFNSFERTFSNPEAFPNPAASQGYGPPGSAHLFLTYSGTPRNDRSRAHQKNLITPGSFTCRVDRGGESIASKQRGSSRLARSDKDGIDQKDNISSPFWISAPRSRMGKIFAGEPEDRDRGVNQ